MDGEAVYEDGSSVVMLETSPGGKITMVNVDSLKMKSLCDINKKQLQQYIHRSTILESLMRLNLCMLGS